MSARKRIGLVAHNNKKAELIQCLQPHCALLAQHELFGTGTTGSLIEEKLNLPVTKLQSGPMGGDQQLGAKIASQELDILLFLIDPLDSHPHSADVQALVRVARVWNIVCATTASSIDFVLTSPKMSEPSTRHVESASQMVNAGKDVKTPRTSIQNQRVPILGYSSGHTLPPLPPKHGRSVPQQTVFKKC